MTDSVLIVRFLHFIGNKNEPDKTDKNYDKLWNMTATSDKINDSYAKYYRLTEHLAVDEITVPFIPKKHKWFGMQLYKLCDSKGYTYNMTKYLG